MQESTKHVQEHEAYEDLLPEADVTKWKTAIEAWEADSTCPNPFEAKSEGTPFKSMSFHLFTAML